MTSQIKTELVRNARQLYKLWWGVASDKDWTEMQKQVQLAINSSIATLAVPKLNLGDSGKHPAIPKSNPVHMDPIARHAKRNGNLGRYAGSIAQKLTNDGHLVFYVTRSTAIDAQYSGQSQILKDILAFAPVVVFYDNQDGRKNGFITDMLMTRQCGILIIVKAETKGGNRND